MSASVETYICPECGTGEPDLHGYNCSRQTDNSMTLLEKLEAATEGSRELDAAIHKRQFPDYNTGAIGSECPTYTTSIDAALALVERVVPGWTIARMGQEDDRQWTCELRRGYLTSYDLVKGGFKFPTLPLAICIALIKAEAER